MANYPRQPVRNWCSNTLVWELEVGQDFVQFLWWKSRQMLAHIWVYAILSKKHWTEKYAWWRTFLLGLWPVRWQFHAVTAREESKILPVLFRMIFCKFPRLPVKQDVTCPLERHLYNLEIWHWFSCKIQTAPVGVRFPIWSQNMAENCIHPAYKRQLFRSRKNGKLWYICEVLHFCPRSEYQNFCFVFVRHIIQQPHTHLTLTRERGMSALGVQVATKQTILHFTIFPFSQILEALPEIFW